MGYKGQGGGIEIKECGIGVKVGYKGQDRDTKTGNWELRLSVGVQRSDNRVLRA